MNPADSHRPNKLELNAYKVFSQINEPYPRPSADTREALKCYDPTLRAMLMDGYWHIFRLKDNKWAFSWPHLVATVKTPEGDFRNLTPSVVEEVRDYCDVFGPRWRGNKRAWERFIDRHEEDSKASDDKALEQALDAHFAPKISKMRRELSQFTLPSGSYKEYFHDDYRGAYQQWGTSQAPFGQSVHVRKRS